MNVSAAESSLATDATVGRVDGVAVRLGNDRFRFTTAFGSVAWRRVVDRTTDLVRYEVESCTGVDLLAEGDASRFVTLDDEKSVYDARPLVASGHGRPYAYESLAELFDDPKVPDALMVPAAGFPLHANTGNHGALTSVQCRGLFLAAGPGVAARGWIAEHGRMIDVAPTLLALLGAPVVEGRGPAGTRRRDARLLAQDGDELAMLLDTARGPARHVVAVLFDGCNTNLLADAVEAGRMPNIASLLARGTGLRHGIVSSFPTVTLPNHVTAFTGVHPGRHGVINNEFLALDGRHVNLLDFGTMMEVGSWINPEVETVHDAVHRWRPEAFTAATYEYGERGADWSTFTEFAAGRRPFYATPDMVASSSTDWAVASSAGYRFQSRIDESSLGSAVEQWRGPSVTGHALPTLQLVNLSLTDSAGHESGPHEPLALASLLDSDRRLGRLLDAIDAAGALADTAVVVLSDHGMEQCDRTLLDTHPHADLDPLLAGCGRHDVGDVLLYAT